MNHGKFLFNAGCLTGAVLLTMLTGCIGYVEEEPRHVVYVNPPVVETAVVVEDDYVYYPGYDVYYNSSRHQYAYLEGGAWVSRPAPRGVSVNVLLASPSVRMDFHDSPAHHHEANARQYPRNWAPSRSNERPGDNRKDDHRDEHRDNRGGDHGR